MTATCSAAPPSPTAPRGAAATPSRVRHYLAALSCGNNCVLWPGRCECNSGYTGNGFQCFDGDCAAGNCSLVTNPAQVNIIVIIIIISISYCPERGDGDQHQQPVLRLRPDRALDHGASSYFVTIYTSIYVSFSRLCANI